MRSKDPENFIQAIENSSFFYQTSLTDEDKKKIEDKIQSIKDEATEAGISWRKGRADKAADKAAEKAEAGKKGESKAAAAIAAATGKGKPEPKADPPPPEKTELEKKIEAKKKEQSDNATKLQTGAAAGGGTDDSEEAKDLVSQKERIDKELAELEDQLPKPQEETA